ncbi:MAG: SUMF1/EgtB/PvdO family nonheme iron enzyme [Magnetococcus sp. YQC-3]
MIRILLTFIIPLLVLSGHGHAGDRPDIASIRAAAEQGNASAQAQVGDIYENGESVHQDLGEAIKWYRVAAEQGHAMAQYKLGRMYDKGEGIVQNDEDAEKWYRKSAAQGNHLAIQYLQAMYDEGRGGSKDVDEVNRFFDQAMKAYARLVDEDERLMHLYWAKQVMMGEFVHIPAGCFNKAIGQRSKKVREVCVDEFEIGKFEVTQEQWSMAMGENPSHFKDCGHDCPVENVSISDILKFISKLNEMEEGRFALPTEAEWEYACRSAGNPETYCGGEDVKQLAWYDGNSSGKTHPVGQKSPNGLGIYDMSGNVSEWVSTGGSRKGVRGGSWFDGSDDARSATHGGSGRRSDTLGFRLVRVVR